MKARVFSNSCIQGTCFKLIFLPHVRIKVLPGQFVMIRASDAGFVSDPLLSRPFSIHRQAMDGSIEILYKVVGKGTGLMSYLRKGDYVEFLGPLGNGFSILPSTLPFEEFIIVAGGIGVAPMVSLIEALKQSYSDKTIKVFLGGRNEEDLLCVEELKSLATEVVLTTNDGSAGIKGYVTDALKEYLSSLIRTPHSASGITMYACGPTPMLQAVLNITEPMNVKTYFSLESAMACGIGLCMGCVVKRREGGYSLVCKDGPVFRGEDIEIGDE